jgi:hypothetical protein
MKASNIKSNNAKSHKWLLAVVLAGLIMAVSTRVLSQNEKLRDYSDKAETAAVQRTAEKVPHLNLGSIVESAAQGNMVGVRSEKGMFSRRLDSRTYFAQDRQYGVTREAGVFAGSDDELRKLASSVLSGLEIPATEIARTDVLQEKSQVAHLDRETGRPEVEKEELGARQVRISRNLEGIPVFSSHALLGFSRRGEIGFMEVHWPEIPGYVLAEAHRLEYKVKNGWRPPERKEVVVESVEAGIIHSPAVGFLMDVYPAIRVIYKPVDKIFGQKPVLFFDREGKDLPAPRQFYAQPEQPGEHKARRGAKEDEKKPDEKKEGEKKEDEK